MPRSVLWGIAAITAATAVALAAVLWSRRRTDEGRWKTGDYLAALGIVLALFGGVLSLLAATNDGDDTESTEVTRFRGDVRAACRGLTVNNQGLSLPALVDAGGNIERQRLIDALNGQLDAGIAILDDLWARPVPDELTEDAAEAHRTADIVIYIERSSTNAMVSELPERIPLDQALTYLQGLGTKNLPNTSAFEAAMSRLAGEDCRPIPDS